MTVGTGFPLDPASLLACSDALVEGGLWADAARFGERAIGPDAPELGLRLEVAWRLLRAGRPEPALARTAGLPDDMHPALPAMRAAALAVRDRSPEALRELVAMLDAVPPRPVSLMPGPADFVAWSQALKRVNLWAESARFAELSMPEGPLPPRMRIASRLPGGCCSGSSRCAARRRARPGCTCRRGTSRSRSRRARNRGEPSRVAPTSDGRYL